jgi:hypothetical protein
MKKLINTLTMVEIFVGLSVLTPEHDWADSPEEIQINAHLSGLDGLLFGAGTFNASGSVFGTAADPTEGWMAGIRFLPSPPFSFFEVFAGQSFHIERDLMWADGDTDRMAHQKIHGIITLLTQEVVGSTLIITEEFCGHWVMRIDDDDLFAQGEGWFASTVIVAIDLFTGDIVSFEVDETMDGVLMALE